jgi:hypothetical protein
VFLSGGVSPEAEKLANKKQTVQRRKSMNGMRGISWFRERLPTPNTFLATLLRGT